MARLILCVMLLLTPVSSQAIDVLHAGQEAPPFALLDLFGRTISLDYFDRHPAVLLFWATSSPGSSELLEDFREYQELWGTHDLAVVAVNVDDELSGTDAVKKVRDFTDQRNIIFPVLLDRGLTMKAAYGVSATPTAVVIDAAGRISSVVAGHAQVLREELKGSLLLAMERGREDSVLTAVADRGGKDTSQTVSRNASATSCSIPRARSCSRIHERDPSASDPAVMAVRLCNCYGDLESAKLMLEEVGKQRLRGLDLRFALAHMMLLQGKAADARRAFESLRDNHPQEGWGEWGLSLVALSEGRAEDALVHMRAARAGGWAIPEAETAVLKYLEQYWRASRTAPAEEQFLALFEELGSVRACYRRLNQKG